MFKDILVPLDLDAESSWKQALPVATAMCGAFSARLHVMTVVPSFGLSLVSQYFPEDYEKKAIAAADERLHELVAEHVPKDVATQCIVADGTIYEEILKARETVAADLIIMSSHRPELRDYLLGPNAARVARHAACSVMVLRD